MTPLRIFGGFLAGLAVATLIVEGAARLIEISPWSRVLPLVELSLYGPDPDTGYAHRPGVSGYWTTENRNWVHISRLGLRDRERPTQKPESGVRLAAIGDSITEALQVPLEETFVYRAEQAINVGGGQPVEIVNLGLSGATPAVIVERLRGRGAQLGSDGVIVVMSVGDLLRATADDTSQISGYIPDAAGVWSISHAFRDSRGYRFRTGAGGAILYAALDHSRVVQILNARRNVGLFNEVAASASPRLSAPAPRSCVDEMLDSQRRLWLSGAPENAAVRTRAFLRDLRADAPMAPISVALLGLEAACSGEDRQLAEVKKAIVDAFAVFDLRSFFVRDELQQRLAPGEQYQSLFGFGATLGRGHLNERGHELMAQLMVEIARDLIFARAVQLRR